MKFKILVLVLFILIKGFIVNAQSPKRELRAAWIATVGNIDWPSKQGQSVDQQKSEFIQHLDFLQELGFNTVIVQVRPAADAFYKSSFEPWSRYLSGKQGVHPGYDPLEFMIAECRKRHIDIHAWFNPYRALVSSNANPNPSSHITKTQPHWLIHYGGKSYFDPGNPEAKDYIIKVMMEAVRNYDFDALHIDDYFYPYPTAGKEFGDNASYHKYGQGMSRADWRRNNVNNFIEQLHKSIKKEKPYMKFGVSPFGIWRNQNQDSEGSQTNGSSCYDELYSDVRLWVKNNWLDYVAPQLYWERGHRAANFDHLLPWWSENKYERDLYIGLGLYRMVDAKLPQWKTPVEILQQINETRKYKSGGVIFYSMSNFYKISHDIRDSLKKENYFGRPSIPPVNGWIFSQPVDVPKLMYEQKGNKVLVNWEAIKHPYGNVKYIVYKLPKQAKVDINNNENIFSIIDNNSLSLPSSFFADYNLIITAVDRLWNESLPSNIIKIP